MTPWSSRLPSGSSTATLQPVRNAGIDRQHDLLGDRRLEQEAPEVAGEDFDGVLSRPSRSGRGGLRVPCWAGSGDRGRRGRLCGKSSALRVALQRELAEERGLDVGRGRPRA